ncbi:MAG: CoA transferase [Chloroflexi bacterium]|nr:CoA transferase [Chloroflexota bacterium]
MNRSALEGVSILECATGIAGAYCAKLLADLGADVIKVEPPDGDVLRQRGPFLHDTPHRERSCLFAYLNTNKSSVTLDLRASASVPVLLDLARRADILIEEDQAHYMERIGVSCDVLAKASPALIVASLRPFGLTGPCRDYKAYPLNLSHGCGLGYQSPGASEFPDRPPVREGYYTCEYQSGISAAVAILGALLWRNTSGKGQQIDISKQDTLISLESLAFSAYFAAGHVPTRFTRAHTLTGRFRCKDGFVQLVLNHENEWHALVDLIGHPDWANQFTYAQWADRQKAAPQVNRHINDWMLRHTREEVCREGRARGIVIAPYNSIAEVTAAEQIQARGFMKTFEHPDIGRVRIPASPYRLSLTPTKVGRPPRLGEHNSTVYEGRLAYSNEGIRALQAAGVI